MYIPIYIPTIPIIYSIPKALQGLGLKEASKAVVNPVEQ
jgi:hypothetical protein